MIKQSGLSAKSCNNYIGVLRKLYNDAIDDKVITANPCAPIKKQKLQSPDERIDPLERNEAETIFNHMRKHYHPQVGNYFKFVCETGLRPSEAIALEWGDIDFTKSTARISRAIVGHVQKGTKTNKSRNIDLTLEALQTLQEQKQYSFFSEDQKIFQNPNTGHGWASSKRQSELYWRPALKALGIRHRPAYNCRHSFACWQLTDGLPVGYVAQQLGHSSITTTLQHYGKWMQSSNSEMLERRNQLAKQKAIAEKKTG